MNASQYVVVGAGLVGAATAWSLARQGREVTVVERTRPAARDGSSHGSARILRYAYPDAFYHRRGRGDGLGFSTRPVPGWFPRLSQRDPPCLGI